MIISSLIQYRAFVISVICKEPPKNKGFLRLHFDNRRNGVQKVKDGSHLGGRENAAEVFDDGFEFDDDEYDFLG